MIRKSLLNIFLVLFWVLPAFAVDIPKWSYDDDVTGQDDWASLSHEYAPCEIGTKQSPIVISETVVSPLPPLVTSYRPTNAKIHNNGRGIIVDVEGEQSLISNGTSYQLKHVAIHSPSEHTIKAKFYMLELQFMHVAKDGRQLILSAFADTGFPGHQGLQPLLNAAPRKPRESADLYFNPSQLLPSLKGYYSYQGSLTTPPCTEGVEWIILKTPMTITHEQLVTIGQLVGRNARLSQPLYMRTVKETQE